MQDRHSTVSASLSGDGRNWQTLDRVIDTGADLVVLPESMIGQLKEIKIAGETLENVEAAFIPDRQLDSNRLLGMSVSARFQLSIDGKEHMITLIKK